MSGVTTRDDETESVADMGSAADDYIGERTVDVSVRRLRVAIGCRGAELIESVRGVGYRFSGKGG